jgi:hypothetical protein
MWHSGVEMTSPNQDNLDEDSEHPAREQGHSAVLSEPALRAAPLALGVGLLWAVLSHERRRRPTDLW